MISSAREGSTQTAAFSPSVSYQNTILVITVNDLLASKKKPLNSLDILMINKSVLKALPYKYQYLSSHEEIIPQKH